MNTPILRWVILGLCLIGLVLTQYELFSGGKNQFKTFVIGLAFLGIYLVVAIK